jgi:hypothetical protein
VHILVSTGSVYTSSYMLCASSVCSTY